MDTLEKIRYLRFINKYSQKEVAEKIHIGRSNYCMYESGEWKFTIEHIKALAKLYNVSVSYLVNEDDNDIVISKDQLDILIKAKNVISDIESAYTKVNPDE